MEQDLGAKSPSRLGGPPRTRSVRRGRFRRRSALLWAAAAVVALLLSACGIRQEIRFNADGSGTARIIVRIPYVCPASECGQEAKRLLGGEGAFANAAADAERLPFDVRIEPFEGADRTTQTPDTGYTLSFDFASLEDLEQKLAPDPSTGRSQTSALEFSGMTLEANGDGGFTFTAESVVPTSVVPTGPGTPAVSLDIVLPGAEGKHNAGFVKGAQGGTRFKWTINEPGQPLQASTCSGDSCPGRSTPIMVVVAVAVLAAVVVAFVLRRRARDERSRRGPRHVA